MVEVACPALKRQGLLPDDLHAFYVVAVPKRLEDAVGEAQAHDGRERLPGEEMVDPEDSPLWEEPVQQPVELLCRVEVHPEWLLDSDPAPLWQVRLFEGLERRGEDHRR